MAEINCESQGSYIEIEVVNRHLTTQRDLAVLLRD